MDPTARVEGPRPSQVEELARDPPEELVCPIMHGLMTGAGPQAAAECVPSVTLPFSDPIRRA